MKEKSLKSWKSHMGRLVGQITQAGWAEFNLKWKLHQAEDPCSYSNSFPRTQSAGPGFCSCTSAETAIAPSHLPGKKESRDNISLCQRKSGFPLIQGQLHQNHKFSEGTLTSSHVLLKPPTLILRKGLGIRHFTFFC